MNSRFITAAKWVLAFLVCNVFYFYAIFGSFGENVICCDANVYSAGAKLFKKHGLLAGTHYSGYRSILNYAFVHQIYQFGKLLGIGDPGASFGLGTFRTDLPYAIGALVAYVVTGCSIIAAKAHQRGFSVAFPAVYLNPITLSFVPVPLQESMIALVLGPLIVLTYLALIAHQHGRSILLLCMFAAAVWMTKSAFLLVAVPTLAIAIFLYVRASDRKDLHRYLLAGVAVFAVIVSPQIYVAAAKFGTLDPYPEKGVIFRQLHYGHEMWRYETLVPASPTERGFGRRFATPYGSLQGRDYFSSLISNPLVAVSLFGGHLVAAFDYTNLKPYITDHRFDAFPLINVVVGFVAFVGLAYWGRRIVEREYEPVDAFLDAVLLGTIALLPIIAVETRFSFLPMIVLSIRAAEWVADGRHSGRRVGDTVIGLAFGFLFALTITVMQQTAVTKLPAANNVPKPVASEAPTAPAVSRSGSAPGG